MTQLTGKNTPWRENLLGDYSSIFEMSDLKKEKGEK